MKVTFPHMGNAWIVIQALLENLDVDYVVPPPNSKETLNIGTQLAPESFCLPLKLNLGNFVQAAAQGADTALMTGGAGPCRFGYYGEMEREILQEAGYLFDVITLEPPDGSLLGLAERIRKLAGTRNTWNRILKAMLFAYRKSVVMDQIEDMFHGFRPLVKAPKEADQLYEEAKGRLVQAMTDQGMKDVLQWLREQMDEKSSRSAKEEGENPLRIAVIGEIYTLLEPFISMDVEKELGNLGALVDRSLYLSGWVGQHVFRGLAQGYRPIKSYYSLAKPYLNHFVGGHAQETIGAAIQFAQEGYEGIVQLLPLGCMPEIVASSILPKIQEDYGIPIMTLTVDEHTGKAGVQTRIEAFVDLLERSRQKGRVNREGVLDLAGK
ncbi:MAG TPA: CoA protein activase [Desulfitobacterium dehalogenans]|uniref:CoA protein activase n=1 Tax=Desulfitobacterium dehalogenans TaxID=36854 RepID=A0A7C7D3V5_9FIRM|nr:CoA protein activase [Desulfitobacterium dehalogenans]